MLMEYVPRHTCYIYIYIYAHPRTLALGIALFFGSFTVSTRRSLGDFALHCLLEPRAWVSGLEHYG